MSFIRALATGFLVYCAGAAELPDPTTSWHPHHLIGCLAALRAPLDANPTDQGLLGRAELAFVELAFSGPAEANGAMGPWLDRAEMVSSERAKLRAGKPVANLADALPDLWLDIVRGDVVTALNNLERFPTEADSPPAQAVRLAITRNLWQTHPPTTALGRYAYISACHDQDVDWNAKLLGITDEADPLGLLLFRRGWPDYTRDQITIRTVYADVVWLLGSSHIADAVALRHLSSLLTALGETAPANADRPTLATAAQHAIGTFACDRVEPLIAAYRICRELRAGDHGLRDPQGKFRLVGYGDVAHWLQDRLYAVSALQSNLHDNDAYHAQYTLIEREFPGSLIAARTRANQNGKESAKSLGPAMLKELDDPLGLSPGTTLRALQLYVQTGWRDAVPTYRALVHKVWPKPIANRRWGFAEFAAYQPLWTCRDDFAPVALAASRRDPYRNQIWRLGRYAEPNFPLAMTEGLPPILERNEPQVDITKLPIAGLEQAQDIAACWQGWLAVDQPGSLSVAMDVDERARLFIGDNLLLRSGNPGFSEMTIPVAAGWLPLRLEWRQVQKKGKIRLLAKTADGSWQPIPADRLSHGPDHQPGLEAHYWSGITFRQDSLPRAIELTHLAARPWMADWQRGVAKDQIEGWQADLALTAMRQALADGMQTQSLHPEWGHALAYSKRDDTGPDLIANFVAHPCCQQDLDYAAAAATSLNRSDLQADFAQRMQAITPCCVGSLIFARTALTRGAFADAIGHFEKLKQDTRWNGNRNQALGRINLDLAILRRAVDNRDPAWEELLTQMADPQNAPAVRLFLGWYTGQQSWEKVVAHIPQTQDGDEVFWYRGLHEVTLGNFAAARELLTPMITTHPSWTESADAGSLLRWLAKQTPETLAALPKAKPLPVSPGDPTPSNF